MSSSNSCLGKIAFKNRSDLRKHCWNMELETLVFARFVSYFVEPKKLTRLLKGWKFCRHSSELIQHFFPAVYVWNSNKESADTERTATNKQGSDSSRSIIAVSPRLNDDFPRPVKRVEGSGESEKEKCKFLGGRSAPIGGGWAGVQGLITAIPGPQASQNTAVGRLCYSGKGHCMKDLKKDSVCHQHTIEFFVAMTVVVRGKLCEGNKSHILRQIYVLHYEIEI